MERTAHANADPVEFRGGAGTVRGDRWRVAEGVAPRGRILMLHGGGQTRHSWDRSARALQAIGWEVITLDARGHAQSDWSPEGDYRIGVLVDDLLAIVDQVSDLDGPDLGRPVVVGASMGGMTGLIAEGEHPGLLRALVLVDITPRIEPEGVARIAEFMRSAPDGFADLEAVADAVSAYRPNHPRPKNIEGLRKNVRTGEDGRLYWHWDPAFHRLGANLDNPVDRRDRMIAACAGITVPTVLVSGGKSDIVSDDGVDELRALVPHASSVVVADATHMVAGDDNDVFVASISDFLDGV
ncbi:alpha/beta fold hydrolase [Gordonia sp. HNM0687]|uniref:Alpha/beta fold hydrolase n=1 Tax=Gordonia mangrovi TaxID=2665643 RepID=A0A6L7GVK9_9ACTN|nr:alpha/beta hydrolase [Gordonia mangrovi]MXP23507.1 alpha/beta fold hydrolase [Gordonia mangrovi]UVF76599.1 alpha/beta hydrolase [Gordonia mangrovi]